MSANRQRNPVALGLCLVLILTGSRVADACESEVAPLIMGGTPAAEGRYPYAVSIQVNGLHSCGGALIAPKWVVTVAGCAGRYRGRESSMKIAIGPAQLSDACAEIIDVASITLEPTDGDLALIELVEPSTQQPIAPNSVGVYGGSNPTFTVVGFGRTSYASSFSQNLQEASGLPLQPRRVCLVVHGIKIRRWICAGDKSHACRGDWGSPLIIPGSDASQDRLAGVTIFPNNAIQCGDDKPGLFVDISRNAGWISSVKS